MSDPTGGGAVEETVPPSLAGERIDRVVAMMTGASRALVGEWVSEGQVLRNGAPVASRSTRVVAGDVIVAPQPGEGAAVVIEADATIPLEVVHVDEDVVVINKQPGLVVHPGTGNPTGTLVHALVSAYPEIAGVGEPGRPGLVHRLDADTSGLLVVARTDAAHAGLIEQFVDHSAGRTYDALVWGHFATPAGRIDAPVGRSRRQPTKMAVSASGRAAMTDYDVVTTYRHPVDLSRLTCRLHTGRTHQIRVHLSSIGHPVVGDPLYGGERESFPVPRLWLHAAELTFVHPRTGATVTYRAPLPSDLTEVLERLT